MKISLSHSDCLAVGTVKSNVSSPVIYIVNARMVLKLQSFATSEKVLMIVFT